MRMISALFIALLLSGVSTTARAQEFYTERVDAKSRASCFKIYDKWTVKVEGGTISLIGRTGSLLSMTADGAFTSPPFASASGNRWVLAGNTKTGVYTLLQPQQPCLYNLVPKDTRQQASK